uniref:Uncharacterized protein n=1 Tax=Oryza nivara TaxID=4536 RepID=A0A0E0IQA8_ORYNI
MSSREWGESGGGDLPRLQGDSSSRNKAKSRTTSLQPGSASEHVAASSAAAVETGLEFGKVDGEAHTPTPMRLARHQQAVAGGLDLDPKRSGVEIQKSKNEGVLPEQWLLRRLMMCCDAESHAPLLFIHM